MPRAVGSEEDIAAPVVAAVGGEHGTSNDVKADPQKLGDLERFLTHVTRDLWRTQKLLVETKAAALAAQLELDAVYRSTSWRVTSPLRMLVGRKPALKQALRRSGKGVWWSVTLQLPQRLRARRLALETSRRAEEERLGRNYEEWIRRYDTVDELDLRGIGEMVQELSYRPLVSVLMPVFDPPEHVLREAIESVRAQVYESWELCIADDASTAPEVRRLLEEYASRDSRIRVEYRPVNGGISAASNSALALARGDVVTFLDHDDLLRPHSLALVVRVLNEHPDAAYVYSDEDTISHDGRRAGHFFKPDWNPALLLCQNYPCHLSVYKTDAVRRVGGFRSEYDGSQDWDLALRITESLPREAIVHVPHVLYHWRAIPGSAATGAAAKPYALDAGRRAVEDHLSRTGRLGYLVPVECHQIVRFVVPSPAPRVSAIVPSSGRPDLLEPCLAGLLRRTQYEPLDIVVAVAEDALEDVSSRALLDRVRRDSRVRIDVSPAGPFNYARTMNRAAALAQGEFLLLVNDDTEVIWEHWLATLVGQLAQERVGVVSPLLVRRDGTIQSAGMLVGARGIAEHLYEGRPADVLGYSNRAKLTQDLSVVSGACMLVRRELFAELGGFDEALAVCYNDIDFCLRLRHAGWRVVFAPDAVLVHHETASFGSHTSGREREHERDVELMRQRWGDLLADDPMHNPNLELDWPDPSRLAFPPRVSRPWRRSPSRDIAPRTDGAQLSANRVGASSWSSEPVKR